MTWTYRVMRRRLGDSFEFGFYEVFMDGDRIDNWTSEPCAPVSEPDDGSPAEALAEELARFQRALTLPILDHETGRPVTDS